MEGGGGIQEQDDWGGPDLLGAVEGTDVVRDMWGRTDKRIPDHVHAIASMGKPVK